MGRLAIIFGGLLAPLSAVALFVMTGEQARAATPDLAAVLAFAEPRECRPSPQLARLLEGLIAIDQHSREPRAGAPVALPGFAAPIWPRMEREFAVGRDAMGFMTFAVLDVRGRWHGLDVIGLRTSMGDDLEIRFSDPPAHVRDTLVRAGFPLPAVDQWRYPGPGSGFEARAMGVQSHRRGGATLRCSL